MELKHAVAREFQKEAVISLEMVEESIKAIRMSLSQGHRTLARILTDGIASVFDTFELEVLPGEDLRDKQRRYVLTRGAELSHLRERLEVLEAELPRMKARQAKAARAQKTVPSGNIPSGQARAVQMSLF